MRIKLVLSTYLLFVAIAGFGQLRTGTVPDEIFILSDDIMTVPEEKILEIKPLATYVGGRKVYSAPQGGF